MEGTIVSHYRIVEPLGRGGMGVGQIAHGLVKAHEVHRDIKPQNVMVTRDVPGEDSRFRPRQTDRRSDGADRSRYDHGHVVVHVARAARRSRRRRADRHLVARRRHVRNADRPAAVQGRLNGHVRRDSPGAGIIRVGLPSSTNWVFWRPTPVHRDNHSIDFLFHKHPVHGAKGRFWVEHFEMLWENFSHDYKAEKPYNDELIET